MANIFLSGPLFVLAFALIGAAQEVYLGNLFQEYDPIFVLFYTFLMTAVFFILANVKNLRTLSTEVRQIPKNVFMINVTTFVSWLSFFLSLKYIEPAIVSAICFCLGPIITSLTKTFHGDKLSRLMVFSNFGIIIGTLTMVFGSFYGFSGVRQLGLTEDIGIGIFYCLMSATTVVGSTIYSKKLSGQGMTPSKIMVVRFPLLLLIAGLITKDHNTILNIDLSLKLLLVAMGTIIIPLFLLQQGIARSEPLVVSMVLSMTPIFTYFFQIFDSRLSPSVTTLSGIIVCTISVIAGLLCEYKDQQSRLKFAPSQDS